jgi:hypothetical protein
MSTRITITLPDDVYRRAESLAQVTSRGVADVLADTLALWLSASDLPATPGMAVASLSDQELLAVTELALPSDQDRRFSELLDMQQSRRLQPAERAELLAFMQIYQQGLLLKARALHEAVQRGLRPPLEP